MILKFPCCLRGELTWRLDITYVEQDKAHWLVTNLAVPSKELWRRGNGWADCQLYSFLLSVFQSSLYRVLPSVLADRSSMTPTFCLIYLEFLISQCQSRLITSVPSSPSLDFSECSWSHFVILWLLVLRVFLLFDLLLVCPTPSISIS